MYEHLLTEVLIVCIVGKCSIHFFTCLHRIFDTIRGFGFFITILGICTVLGMNRLFILKLIKTLGHHLSFAISTWSRKQRTGWEVILLSFLVKRSKIRYTIIRSQGTSLRHIT